MRYYIKKLPWDKGFYLVDSAGTVHHISTYSAGCRRRRDELLKIRLEQSTLITKKGLE